MNQYPMVITTYTELEPDTRVFKFNLHIMFFKWINNLFLKAFTEEVEGLRADVENIVWTSDGKIKKIKDIKGHKVALHITIKNN